ILREKRAAPPLPRAARCPVPYAGPAMPIRRLFPTQIWTARLALPRGFQDELLREIRTTRELDREGRAWCRERYHEGYTSYSSVSNLHERSTTFELLKKKIDAEVRRYVRALDLDAP